MPTLDQLLYGKTVTKTMPSGTKEYILYGKKVELTREAYQYYVDKKIPIREAQIWDFHERYNNQKPYQTVTTPPTIPANSGGNAPANTGGNTGFIREDFAHDKDEWGYDYLYGKRDFQSDEDIWKKIHEMHPVGTGRANIYGFKPEIQQMIEDEYSDDIARLHQNHADQEKRISKSAEGGEDCGWFGEKCWFPEWDMPDLSWLKYVGIAIGIGVLLWLIRPLMKIGANLSK